MITVFKNEIQNKVFLQEGFIVGAFITPEILTTLIEFYRQYSPKEIAPFHTTHFSTDRAYKKQVNDGLIQILAPFIESLLESYVPAFANFMVKPGGGSHMPLHADWSYVPEPEHIGLSLWIPLIDTTIQNGQLGVIPYSQNISRNIRGPRIDQVFPPFDTELIKKCGKLLPLKAGQAVFYDHRLLHYSPPNQTSETRPAINISIVPKSAKILHYMRPEGKDFIQKYEVDDFSFFVEYDHFQVPEQGNMVSIDDAKNASLIHDNIPSFIKYNKRNFLQRVTDFLKR